MTANDGALLGAIKARSDDRGYCRTTFDELAADTAMSRSTIKRRLKQIVDSGGLQMRTRPGSSGGILLRIPNRSQTGHQTGHQTGQTGQNRNAFDQTPSPEGALGGLISNAKQVTEQVTRRDPAHRTTAHHERPASGAALIYTGPGNDGKWRRLTNTLWEAPNGDAVSIRSMTPELRLHLKVLEDEQGNPALEAIRAIQTVLTDEEIDVR